MIEDPFVKGEIRVFEFQVFSNDPKRTPPVVISSAVWELKLGEIIASRGSCEVDNDVVSMVVPLLAPGDYVLEVRAEVPPETIIGRMRVRVVE